MNRTICAAGVASSLSVVGVIMCACSATDGHKTDGTAACSPPAAADLTEEPVADEAPSPMLPIGEVKRMENGVVWRLALVPEISTSDSVWVSSHLENASGRRLKFDVAPASKGPIVVLTPKGHVAKSRPFLQGAGLDWMTYNRQPKTGELMHSFRIDLREYFGRFEAGDYEVHLVWDATGFSIHGLLGRQNPELRSPTLKFRVTKMSKVETPRPAYTMILRDGRPAPIADKLLPTGTFTNRLNESIVIPVTVVRDSEGQKMPIPPLRIRPRWSRFHPKLGWENTVWRQEEAGKHEDLLWYTLKPLESVKVVLPDGTLDGDGVYIYNLPVYGGPNERDFITEVESEPFTVDTLRTSPNAASSADGPSQRPH